MIHLEINLRNRIVRRFQPPEQPAHLKHAYRGSYPRVRIEFGAHEGTRTLILLFERQAS